MYIMYTYYNIIYTLVRVFEQYKDSLHNEEKNRAFIASSTAKVNWYYVIKYYFKCNEYIYYIERVYYFLKHRPI